MASLFRILKTLIIKVSDDVPFLLKFLGTFPNVMNLYSESHRLEDKIQSVSDRDWGAGD